MRTLYTEKGTDRQTDAPVQTKGIYMCIIACIVGVFMQPASAKRATKAEKQNKPIHGTKNLQGRVAPPLWGCVFMGLPHLKIFFNFFCIVCVRCFFDFFCFLFVIC